MNMFDELKNSFDFFIRQKTRFSRKGYKPYGRTAEQNYLENLYMLDVLDKYFPFSARSGANQENIAALDIGSKNWAYAPAQHAFFQKYAQNFTLTGIELDAHRLYPDLYSRAETAKFYIKNLPEADYIAGDLLNLNKKFDVIIWFLPFVYERPHKKWGLPMKYFKPEALLKHAYDLLNPQGVMFIVNQGDDEYQMQQKLLADLGAPFTLVGEIKSTFSQHKLKRFATLVAKS